VAGSHRPSRIVTTVGTDVDSAGEVVVAIVGSLLPQAPATTKAPTAPRVMIRLTGAGYASRLVDDEAPLPLGLLIRGMVFE
jgi:hypothetical protein